MVYLACAGFVSVGCDDRLRECNGGVDLRVDQLVDLLVVWTIDVSSGPACDDDWPTVDRLIACLADWLAG